MSLSHTDDISGLSQQCHPAAPTAETSSSCACLDSARLPWADTGRPCLWCSSVGLWKRLAQAQVSAQHIRSSPKLGSQERLRAPQRICRNACIVESDDAGPSQAMKLSNRLRVYMQSALRQSMQARAICFQEVCVELPQADSMQLHPMNSRHCTACTHSLASCACQKAKHNARL